MKIAVMQPYFAPYLGYFELIRQVDLFVLFDDVQHIRRGWVHRNKLLDHNGQPQWLTLPLVHVPQNTLIRDLVFTDDANARMYDEAARFPAFDDGKLPIDVVQLVAATHGSFVPYCTRLLVACCRHLGIKPKIMHSDDLSIPRAIKGRSRIVEICRQLGATEYLNASGGRELYNEADFQEAGIKLEFLPPWAGRMESVLEVLAKGHNAAVHRTAESGSGATES